MDNLSLMEQAKELRSKGLSLDKIVQILKQPRSTVYYWIRKVPLTSEQMKELEIKRGEARKKGSRARHSQRLRSIKLAQTEGLKDIGNLSGREIFLIGVALYWAEGAKQSKKNISQAVEFCNQDPRMVKVYCRWLDIIKVPPELRQFTLYIHKQHLDREEQIKHAWEKALPGQILGWQKTILKKHETTRRISHGYIGLLRIKVRKSSQLNRRIAGWISTLHILT